MNPIQVTVWNEFLHERERDDVRSIYPTGIHQAIADGLRQVLGDRVAVQTATLDQPDHGLGSSRLDQTDVLLWWGHMAHDQVSDQIVDRVQQRVLSGMGLVVLHSGHASKIFQRLMGTGCMLRWREAGELERIWVTDPAHPIARSISGEYFELPQTEMYGEFFDVPAPDSTVFISWFEGGEVFRSGLTYHRGAGRIFYFRPGHETFPIYYHPQVKQILADAVVWACRATNSAHKYQADARHIPAPVHGRDSN